jgi:hypothetical protein
MYVVYLLKNKVHIYVYVCLCEFQVREQLKLMTKNVFYWKIIQKLSLKSYSIISFLKYINHLFQNTFRFGFRVSLI